MSCGEILEARGVGRRSSVGGDWLLRDASLVVVGGDRVAITGRIGSGKTLFLRSLAMLDPLEEGEILWHGERVHGARVPGYRRQVMYLHQQPALREGTVEENLRAPFDLCGHSDTAFDRERIADLLGSLGRDDSFLRRHRQELSGGETRIVALVRAIELAPQVLLLDEPTAALDNETTLKVEALIDRWLNEAAGERAIVWVTHVGEQVRRVSSRTLEVVPGTRDGITGSTVRKGE